MVEVVSSVSLQPSSLVVVPYTRRVARSRLLERRHAALRLGSRIRWRGRRKCP